MKYLYAIFVLLFALPSCFRSTQDLIVEHYNITDVYNYLQSHEFNKDTLVIFDIDNTLIEPADELKGLGSDQWFYALFNQKKKEGLSEQEALAYVLPILFYIQKYLWFVPIEPTTASLVNDLQQKGVTVIGLTARSLELAEDTLHQLHDSEIDFLSTTPHRCPIVYNAAHPSLYIDGIVFSGNNSKGEVLAHWFSQIDYYPKKVIFVDDKMHNIEDVEKALHKRNYPFIGIRYSHVDDKVKQFKLDDTLPIYETFMKKYPPTNLIVPSSF